MPVIYIDDQAHEVPEGDNVLEACLSAGIDLPYFCWHPEMGSVGACRQCALLQFRDADDTNGRVVMGCMTPVSEGARFSMKGRKASEFRSNIVESLMLNHPHDCPVCAEGGECHLQDMTVMVGHRNRSYRGKKNTHTNQNLGPLIHHEMNRCITCYRCTRFYNDYAGGKDLSAQASRDHVYFGRHEEGTLESEFAGNLVEVCPTGVFTDKPLVSEYTRKWDLQSAPSVCTGCAVGCNTLPGERYGKLKRIHNRFNNEVNGYFLCDRGRYGGAYVNDASRPQYAGLRQEDGRYNAIDSDEAIQLIGDACAEGKVVGIGSPRASLETNYLLRQFVGEKNFVSGAADKEASLLREVLNIMRTSGVHTPSNREIEGADAVLILGEDVTNVAARTALALRQSVRTLAKSMAAEVGIPDWQDEAVRNLAQDRLSPLHIVAVSDTKLDDVARSTSRLAPDDIARFGFAVADALAGNAVAEGFDKATITVIESIASDLKTAKRPLVISGTGSQSSAIIAAATSVAQSLNQSLNSNDAMLSFCLPESNSLGLAMLLDEPSSEARLTDVLNFSELSASAERGEVDTLIVVENDLYRRAPKSQIDKLLGGVKNVITLDVITSDTVSKSSLALPSASFAEAEGTLVNNEGRAQRHFPVYLPTAQRKASWQWLNELLGDSAYSSFDDVTQACSESSDVLNGITEASPDADFRLRGLKIPRQTHRYSGRTAMRADISVHEPQQPQDESSPLAFTMEGDTGKQPGALLPYVWSPGWNSNQSLHKFQSEVGGALAGGTAGARLIEGDSNSSSNTNDSVKVTDVQALYKPDAHQVKQDQWLAVPLYRLFGSDELSVQSPAVAELVPSPFVQLSTSDAENLGAQDGAVLELSHGGVQSLMRLEVNDTIADGCIGYSVGLPEADFLNPATTVSLSVIKEGAVNV